MRTYYKGAKQKRTIKIKGISTDGTPLKCLYSEGCDAAEETIDVTQAAGMAPGLKTIYIDVGLKATQHCWVQYPRICLCNPVLWIWNLLH